MPPSPGLSDNVLRRHVFRRRLAPDRGPYRAGTDLPGYQGLPV
jgi:hypothetical protein